MMIRSIGYALSWEYWRSGMWWFVPACAALVVALVAPAYAAVSLKANVPEVRAALNHIIAGLVCWAPIVMALASRGALRRQYTLPVRTAVLVGWSLANGAMMVAITYWLVAISLNTLFHADWPLWGPAWWAVMIYAALQAAVWSAGRGRGGLLIAAGLVTALWVFGGLINLNLAERLAPTAGPAGTLVWPTISAAELAASLAFAALCCLAAVYLVARDRRGEVWPLDWLSPGWWAQRIGDSLPAPAATDVPFTPRTFRSPHWAQFWMEWRSKGRYVPLATAGTLVVLWVVAVLNRFDWNLVSVPLVGLTTMMVVAAPFVGVYLGHRSERFDIKPFLATRPLTDGEHAMVVLGNVAAACATGALLWFIGFAVTVAFWARPVPPLPNWHEAVLLSLKAWILLGYFLLAWTLAALGASLGMARSWLVPTAGLGGAILLFLLINIAGQSPFLPATIARFLLVAGPIVGTAAAFVAARRRRLVSQRLTFGALATYVALVTTSLLIAHLDGVRPLAPLPLLSIISLCALPLAPLAAAPLALAWNRHR